MRGRMLAEFDQVDVRRRGGGGNSIDPLMLGSHAHPDDRGLDHVLEPGGELAFIGEERASIPGMVALTRHHQVSEEDIRHVRRAFYRAAGYGTTDAKRLRRATNCPTPSATVFASEV